MAHKEGRKDVKGVSREAGSIRSATKALLSRKAIDVPRNEHVDLCVHFDVIRTQEDISCEVLRLYGEEMYRYDSANYDVRLDKKSGFLLAKHVENSADLKTLCSVECSRIVDYSVYQKD